MGGHATHDEREAREIFSDETFQYWGQRDPIGVFEAWLAQEGVAPETLATIEAEVDDTLERAAQAALARRETDPPRADELLEGIYA